MILSANNAAPKRVSAKAVPRTMNTHVIPTSWSGMTKGNVAADDQFMVTASLAG
jgi:hypothetical protein